MTWADFEEEYGESKDDHLDYETCPECFGEGCNYCNDTGLIDIE